MKSIVVITVSALITLNAVAGSLTPTEVSSEAKWVIHMDASRLRATELGRHITESTDCEAGRAKMAAFRTMANFDPSTDLESLTVYGTEGGKHNGVAILHGKFDTAKLATLAQDNETYESGEHAGQTIHSWVGKHKSHHHGNRRTFGCILNATTLAFSSSREMLVKGLDVLSGSKPGLAADAPLAGLMNVDAMYFLSAAALMGDMQQINPRAAILRNTKNAVMAVGEKEGILQAAVEMTTSTVDAALNLTRLLNGMIGMAMLNAEANPDMAAIAKATSVSLNGSTLSLALELPVTDVFAHIEKMKAGKSSCK
jgi:hypothetical protein